MIKITSNNFGSSNITPEVVGVNVRGKGNIDSLVLSRVARLSLIYTHVSATPLSRFFLVFYEIL